eukprot:2802786-Amphidinium_carterae.1
MLPMRTLGTGNELPSKAIGCGACPLSISTLAIIFLPLHDLGWPQPRRARNQSVEQYPSKRNFSDMISFQQELCNRNEKRCKRYASEF